MTIFILPTLLLVTIFCLICYCWSKRKQFLIACQLPGPTAIPVFGNALSLVGHNKDVLGKLEDITGQYEHPMRFWLGTNLLIMFSKPNHVEKILMSSKVTHKNSVYKCLEAYTGKGLITSSGIRWKLQRKLVQPLFNARFVQDSVPIIQKHTSIFIKKLEKYLNQSTFDVSHDIHTTLNDVIEECVMDSYEECKERNNEGFVKAFQDMYFVAYSRIVRPWLQIEFLFKFSHLKKIQDLNQSAINDYVLPLIRKAKLATLRRLSANKNSESSIFKPTIMQLAEINIKNPNCMNEEDFIGHIRTIYAASEDTTASIASFTCLCFGMYPEYQQKAFEEVKSILGDKSKTLQFEDVTSLKYVEMCIKEVLRLFPVAPYIIRQTTSNFKLDKLNIPEGCAIFISIMKLHQDPLQWEKPQEFFPDHFLPETVAMRHPFAFIPFSAGPRGCIGKLYAYTILKVFIANILQHYEIEADGKYKNIKTKADISVRSVNGYNIRLKRRVWE